ncbi:MAG: adenylate/guanylate cyclase domain-containing protein [Magnetococcales bacterium]|nr:adenylate/guanylate cyclase domain-containing protein [Magnetococcales bacterium]
MQKTNLDWAVRVGVHVGPVVAGIVGQARYQFDIWGDTVNMAARLAGLGGVGSVAVVESSWREVSNQFEGRSLGVRPIKGKGDTLVYEILR